MDPQSAVRDVTEMATQYTQSGYDMSLTYILLGFSLAAALAWTDAVKYFIKTFVKVPGTKGMYHFLFAVVVTIIAVLAWDVTRRYLGGNVRQVPIVGMVGA